MSALPSCCEAASLLTCGGACGRHAWAAARVGKRTVPLARGGYLLGRVAARANVVRAVAAAAGVEVPGAPKAPQEAKKSSGLDWGSLWAASKKPSESSSASLGQLWTILKPERTRLQLSFAALLASSSVNLSYPYLMGKLIDLFGDGEGGLTFVMDHCFACGSLVLFGGAATFCRLFLIETAIERVAYRLRREFFGALLRRDVAFFDLNKTGELTTRLSNDITLTSRVLIDVSMGARSTITACVGTCMVFHLAPAEMMTVLLAPVASLFVVGVAYGRVVRKIASERQDRLASAVQLSEERLAGIRTVRTFNAEASELRSFEKGLDRVYEAGYKNALATGGLSCFFVTGGGLFLLHIVYNCGMMVTSGVLTMGATVSLAMYCFYAGSSYTGLMTAYGDIQKSLGACQKVLEILSEKDGSATTSAAVSAPMAAPNAAVANGKPLSLRFENVTFAYPARPNTPVLNGMSLDIPAGARVALLGRSGSGKSSVAMLAAGLYAPGSGRVFADGVDIFAEPGNAVWVRSQLGVISQEPTLFALSIRENIAYGMLSESSEVDYAPLLEAVRAAHVEEFSSQLPEGLETSAGERGQALSGGQKQRVCIARALARNPRMFIFDEATSALDLRSERLVHTALRDILSSGASTSLVITHRLSALQWVDRVAVMDEGTIVQYGLRDEVMANPCEALQSILRSDAPAGV